MPDKKVIIRNAVSLILGLFLSAVFSGLVYYFLMLATLDLFGIDSIVNPEVQDAKIFFTTLALMLLTILVVALLIKGKKLFAAIGVSLPVIVAVGILVIIAPRYLDKSTYREPFDQDRWLAAPNDRLKMARQMIDKETLLGLPIEEVVNKLGHPQVREPDSMLVYWVHDYAQLAISIKDLRVQSTNIWVKD